MYPQAMAQAKENLKDLNNITFVEDNFSNIKSRVDELGIGKVDGILYDLGTSYYQLTDEARGFTYHGESTLDMRMNQDASLDASVVVNTYSQSELERVFKEYGEVREYKKVASLIVNNRPFSSSKELADFLSKKMYKGKLLRFACVSILASASLQAVSLKESVDRVLATNPEVLAEKNNQEAFRKYIDERNLVAKNEGVYFDPLNEHQKKLQEINDKIRILERD